MSNTNNHSFHKTNEEETCDIELSNATNESANNIAEAGKKYLEWELGKMKTSLDFSSQVGSRDAHQRPKERLVYLDWLRAMAILSVILVHAMEQLPSTAENTPQWMIERKDGFMRVFCTFGVPIFFYISGTAQALNRQNFWTYSKKRVLRMLLPTILAIPILLQPTQYMACNTGHTRKWCKAYFPDYPITYLSFLKNWYSSGLAVFSDLHWLWFLPAMLCVDLLNYAPGRIMLYLLEGGFYGKNGKKRPLKERGDIIASCVLNLLYLTISGFAWPGLIPYQIAFVLAIIFVCIGLRLFVNTRQYPVWFITCWIFPIFTALLALWWPHQSNGDEAAGSILLTFNLFTIFSLQGQLEQMALPYWLKFERDGGKNYGLYKIIKVSRFIWTLFWFSISIPSSGTENRISQVPMYRKSPELAFLGQIGTWVALKIMHGIAIKYYNEVIDEVLFLHITQSPIIIYLFHMPLIVLSFGISDCFSPSISFVYTFLVDTTFVFITSFLIYYMLLQSKVTRAFFGLKKELKTVKSQGYQRI